MPVLPHHGVMPVVPATAWVAPTAVVAGDVVLGEHSSIWFGAVVRGDVHSIRIGDRTVVQDNSTVHVTHDAWPAIIGSDVIAGHNVVLHGCTVRDRVLVGIGAILLDGVEVGEESIVAAGSLLTPGTKIPPRSLVVGRPARVLRATTPEEVESLILGGVRRYVAYKETYRAAP